MSTIVVPQVPKVEVPPEVLHRLDALEWVFVQQESALTRLDNDYTVIASEVEELKKRPVTTTTTVVPSGTESAPPVGSNVLSDVVNQLFVHNKLVFLVKLSRLMLL